MRRTAAEFRVLGPIEVVRDGVPVALGGPRQQVLLALLLVNRGRPVQTDVLADELWRGAPPEGFRTTVRSYVSRLRHVLGDDAELASHGAGYSLHIDPDTVDLSRFERLVEEGNRALAHGHLSRALDSFDDALALWSGPALGGSFDGALRLEAERLEQQRLLVLEQRAETALGLGRAAEIVDELDALVRAHPFRERLWRLLMLALYHSERQAEALEVYRRARSTLAEELGLDPGGPLRELEQAILRGQVPTPAWRGRRRNVPAPVSSFVGRESELTDVEDLLTRARLVTLTGVGGVGKTRLAIEVASRRAVDQAGDVLFSDLSGLTEPAQVLTAVSQVFGAPRLAPGESFDALVESVAPVETLLVLDNCEHLAAACAELTMTLLSRCPQLRVLATSRTALGIPGELDHPVPPLSLTSDTSRASEAVELFLARARAARPQLLTDPTTLDAAARICAELDGLPLAIELAAARARSLAPEEIATRLADRFRFLVSWRRLSPARHQTLRQAMDWSHALLSEDERALLARISVFAGGFTLEAAAAVCLAGDEAAALTLVDRLVVASLVVAEAHDGGTRYRLLETVRQYGSDRLAERGEVAELRDRHLAHLLAFAEHSWSRQIDAFDDWARAMTTEQLNLRAALGWCRTTDRIEELGRLLAATWRFWWIIGDPADGRRWLEIALAQGADLPAAVRAELHEGAAGLAWAQGDLDVAENHAHAGLTLYEAAGDRRGTLSCAIVLGHVALNRDHDWRGAEGLFERARRLAEEGGLGADAAVAVHNLGSVAFAEEALTRAADLYREARRRYAALDDAYGVALSELYLGLVDVEDGRHDDAASHLARALPVFRQMHFRQYAGQCLEGVAAVARARGDAVEAVRLLSAGSDLRERSGSAPDSGTRLRAREQDALRTALGDDAFAAAWAAGRALPEETLLDRAQAVVTP